MSESTQTWIPIKFKDLQPTHRLYKPVLKLKLELDSRADLERGILFHVNHLGEVQGNLQEAAEKIVDHIKLRRLYANDHKRRFRIIIPGRSGFISYAFLRAAIAKHGDIGVPETEWIFLDQAENASLYKRSRDIAIKNAGTVFKKHDIKQDDSLVVLDDYYGMGIKARDYNTLFDNLGFGDYSLAYFSGYTGTTGELPRNVVIGSRNLHLTGLINGTGNLLKEIDRLPLGEREGERLLKVASIELAKLI